MWGDIGLRDRLFDLDKPEELARVAPTALAMVVGPAAAKAKAGKPCAAVHDHPCRTMQVLKQVL